MTKGCDNQRDLAAKISGTYLPGGSLFNVRLMGASKASKDDVLKNYSSTAFVMAATEPQAKVFLEAMADLQIDLPERRTVPVKGWILVYDESDALRT